jgi:hypothetical protein
MEEPVTKSAQREGGVGGKNGDGGNSPLAPATSGRSKWRRLLLRGWNLPVVSLVLGVVLVAKFQMCKEREPTCREVWTAELDALAVLICQEEYAERGEPRVGAMLADSLLRTKNRAAAKKLAERLVETEVRGLAQRTLGKIARTEGDAATAQRLFASSTEFFTQASDWPNAAKSILAWAKVTMEQQEYVDALEQLDRCAQLAKTAGNKTVEAACHLGASRTLLELGNGPGAMRQLEKVRALKIASEDLQADFIEANYFQELGEHEQAVARFKELLAGPQSPMEIQLNLAYSLIRLGRLDEAAEHLKLARDLDAEKDLPGNTASVESLLAWKRGDLARGKALAAQALAKFKDDEHDDKAVVSIDLTEMLLQEGSLQAAIEQGKASVDWLEKVRAKQQRPQFRSWITERFRKGYEVLFLAQARAGRAADALETLDRWQRHDFLDRLTPPPPTTGDMPAVVADARRLLEVSSSLRSRAAAKEYDLAQLRRQLAGEDLLALVVAQNEVWRLTSYAGELHLERLGALVDEQQTATELARRIDRFTAAPLSADGQGDAAALGALLIPSALAPASPRVLHVLIDPRWKSLPVEALQLGGRRLGVLRPVVRVVRPSALDCAEPLPASPSVAVISDPAGDLPASAANATSVAAAFGVANQRGEKATRANVLDAIAKVDLLHLAMHSRPELESAADLASDQSNLRIDSSTAGGALLLHDDNVRALDIATRSVSPALVVLASCASGIAELGNTSLARAFLLAGSRQVVATLRRVEDQGAAQVSAEFYRQGGALDPVRAMAQTRSQLSAAGNLEWPKFVVFGRQTCKSSRSMLQ